MIRRFELLKANEKIEERLDVAMQLPFCDTDEQIDVLRKKAGL